MAKNSQAVTMGVCDVTFGGLDLGYTKGGVSLSYSTESSEVIVDQEDIPVSERITKTNCEIKVPMAEYDLARFEKMLPSSKLVVDGTDPNKKKLVISGETGTNLLDLAAELVLTPAGGDANQSVTLHKAIPLPSMEFSFEKDNQRVFEVTFKGMKSSDGFLTFGDTSATA